MRQTILLICFTSPHEPIINGRDSKHNNFFIFKQMGILVYRDTCDIIFAKINEYFFLSTALFLIAVNTNTSQIHVKIDLKLNGSLITRI